ncbi:MAG TPA: serine hydrolase domain-containing protein [Ignavibacteriaceae bacterium]|nr:serine hydrolase domain-containing protein [Ignavibacteriaceae bacterium]
MKSSAIRNKILLGAMAAAFIAVMNSCGTFVPQPPDHISDISALEAYINELVEIGIPPGLSLAVVKDGRIVYCKGFGWADRPRKIPASCESVYHWWSITKIATAIAVFQLQEKGKLHLDDQVIQYLPFFKVQYPSRNSKTITIRNLLNHSSGLPDPGLDIMTWIHHDWEPPFNQTELVKYVLPKYSDLLFEPGTQTSYTNIGYMLLGAVIEKITGGSYEDYIRQNILQPLGMNQTDFLYTEAMKNEAAGSHPVNNPLTPLMPLILDMSYVRGIDDDHIWLKRVYTHQTPSTGLIGSVSDAALLAAAYLNGGELNGKRILSGESVYSMTHDSQIKVNNGDSLNYPRQGLGWRIYAGNKRWVITHDGGGIGFATKIQLYPDENLGFVLFANDVTCETWKIINLAATLQW